MDADPHSGELPGSQVMIDGLPLGEVARQHAPLDSPLRHIKDGIEHRSHTQGARASTAFGGGDQIFDPLPFFVSQVAWIDFFVHLPIVPTYEDFSDRLLGRLQQEPGGEQLIAVLRRYAPTWLVQLPSLVGDTELEALQRKV